MKALKYWRSSLWGPSTFGYSESSLDYTQTMNRLKDTSISDDIKIPESIKSEVLINLVPEYEKQKEREALKDRVSVLSIALVLVNSVLDHIFDVFVFERMYYPIQWFGNAVIGSLLLISFYQLVKPQIYNFIKYIPKSFHKIW